MAKLTAVIVTIIGVLMLVQALNLIPALNNYYAFLFAIGVLVIGIGKLTRNFSKKSKR
jgi:predicted tellurium resistance membrane protein TerC